jgi:hypothetical protein
MTSEQLPLLPTELTARFLHLCKSPTVHGTQQAKCSFLYDGKEYMGILFPPDGEAWFEEVARDTLIKACRISPCDNEKYPGEYKGTALPLGQQSLEVLYTPVKTESVVIDMSLMPVYLREAAATIEALLAAANKAPTEQPQEQAQKRLPFRSKALWEGIVRDIILENKRFCLQPFSTLSINSYIDACFDDFWEGDVQLIAGKVRWRAQITSAISSLIAYQIIERVPGMQKHYQITEKTRQGIPNHGH